MRLMHIVHFVLAELSGQIYVGTHSGTVVCVCVYYQTKSDPRPDGKLAWYSKPKHGD